MTRKITRAVGRIKAGLQNKLFLGNLEARRDWGFARDYVKAMWSILQHNEAGYFVVWTKEAHSMRELYEEAFSYVNLDWQQFVKVDQLYFRPTEVDYLLGDSFKAHAVFGWKPMTRFVSWFTWWWIQMLIWPRKNASSAIAAAN